jgi:hypothetical protein
VVADRHTVGGVTGTSVSRAAVFTQQSQDVEVCLDGSWWPGSILGWRHDDGGACEVWVRAVVDGDPREVWTDLAAVRPPEPSTPPTVTLVVAPGVAPGGAVPDQVASSAATTTLGRAAARERLVAGVLATPELPAQGAAAGRRRRHGGDVTAELPAVPAGAAAGRHRAPGSSGRHRAADELAAGTGTPTVVAPPAAVRPEADCLTRPLRLGDRPSRPRLPRPGVVVGA